MKQKRKKLTFQLLLLTVIIGLIAIAGTVFVIYKAASKSYLDAKNDMITKDLKRIYEDMGNSVQALQWFTGYLKEHPDSVGGELSDEEYNYLFNEYYPAVNEKSSEEISEYTSKLPEESS